MTRDEILRMALEAGFAQYGEDAGEYRIPTPAFHGRLELFAALVEQRAVAAEREACAKVCEEQMKSYMSKRYTTDPLGGFRERFAAEQCAAAIRARGES